MPRISAPTVAEHHEMRRDALLSAASQLLAEHGLAAVTPANVGAAAGLARSSVYQYFPSVGALLAAVVERDMPIATAAIANEVAAQEGPMDRIRSYLAAALRFAADPTHQSLAGLTEADLPPECRARVGELHRAQLEPLVSALTELGVAAPSLTAGLLFGMVQAAATAVVHGAPADEVAQVAIELALTGISGSGP